MVQGLKEASQINTVTSRISQQLFRDISLWVICGGPERTSFLVLSKLSLLGDGVLGYSLGSLRHGVFGQFSREEQTDSTLDLSGGDHSYNWSMANMMFFINKKGYCTSF